MDKMVEDTSAQNLGTGKTPVDIHGLATVLKKNNEDREAPFEEEQRESGAKDREAEPGVEQAAKKQFTEKKIRNLIKAPFELWFFRTGCEEVRLKDEEVDLVLEDAVDVLNELVDINPLWLAVIGLTVNGTAIIGNKYKIAQEFKKAKNAKAGEQKRDNADRGQEHVR